MLAAAVCALLVVAAAAGASPGQDCTPARAATVAVHGCVWTGGHVLCRSFPTRYAAGSGAARLRLAGTATGRDLAAGTRHCVLLESFERNYHCKESLGFQNFTVGWVRFAPGTGNKWCGDCIRELRIMEDVVNMKQFKYESDMDLFWDFSNPVFNAETGTLVSVTFNRFNKTIPCKIWLANVQYLGNTSVETFRLYRNEDSSSELKLGFMPKMRDFRIGYSHLGKFPEDAAVQMPALELLSLNYVGLSAVPAAVAGMRSLQTLELCGARLGRLAGQLPPMPSLVDLALEDAGLCCLSDDHRAFAGLPELEFLSVSNNSLTSIGSALSQLHNLEELYASDNLLTEYPQLDTRKSVLLVLHHNRLHTLPHCAHFGQNVSVMYLDISYNQIASWDDHPDILWCVQSLNLSYNEVGAPSAGMLRALDRVRQVDLGGNPVQCRGCPLVRLQRWLLATQVEVLSAKQAAVAAQLLCAGPPVVAGLPVGAAPSSEEDCWEPQEEAAGAAGEPQVALAAAVGLAVVAALAVAGAGVCYRYRFELAYSAHLLRLRLRARNRGAAAADAASFLYDAFILYSGGDRQWVVDTLVPLLEKGPQQYRVCLHERDFQLGTVIVQNISRSMDRSRHTIVVLSKNFVSSKWCMWEMDLAHHRTLEPSQREFIILLELEPLERSQLPRHVRFLMDTRARVPWHGDHRQGALRALTRLLGRRQPQPPNTATTSC